MTAEAATLETLATEIAQLRDLFQRRLLEDRRRQELYDRLCQELDFARSDLIGQFIAPMCRELLLMTDRVDAARRGGADPAVLLASMFDEVNEVLARRGVRPIAAEGELFDPRLHEAVDRAVVADDVEEGGILHVHRAGHLIDARVLRPAQVVVGRHDTRDGTG
jgi:molecular chaperone GrpE